MTPRLRAPGLLANLRASHMKLNRFTTMGTTAVALALTGCSREPTRPSGDILIFTAIPDQNKVALVAKYDPVAQYLSRQLGVPCRYLPSTDYDASVRMFENGDVHLAWFGGLTGVQARHNVPGARVIAQGKEDPSFFSYFIAHRATGLSLSTEFPQAMAGKSFTFGPNKSTSGRLMPEYFIRQHTGKSPEAFFGQKPGFSGNHDATIELVASGKVQVGALNYKTYANWAAKPHSDTRACHVIWKTPTYADYNFTAHPALETIFGEGFTDKVQAALLAMDRSLARSAFDRETLIAARDEDFANIEMVARDLGFIR